MKHDLEESALRFGQGLVAVVCLSIFVLTIMSWAVASWLDAIP